MKDDHLTLLRRHRDWHVGNWRRKYKDKPDKFGEALSRAIQEIERLRLIVALQGEAP